MKLNHYLLIACCFVTMSLFSQDHSGYQTFKSTRIINSHSVETLPARKLDFRIVHRFGDFAGDFGGWETFYGLENAQDILIGFEYGISDRVDVGLSRTKGSGPLKRLLHGSLKAKLIGQKQGGAPLTITTVATTSYSTMQKSDNPEVINNFPKNSHRLVYNGQILFARKFSEGFSFQVIPGYTYRNVTPFGDENGIFSLAVAARLQLSKVLGLLVDFTLPFSDIRTSVNGYYPALGVGLEVETGGHVFALSFTNSKGIAEADYIPYTNSNWSDGQYRMGFTISRWFNL